jgi:hypothetical protein
MRLAFRSGEHFRNIETNHSHMIARSFTKIESTHHLKACTQDPSLTIFRILEDFGFWSIALGLWFSKRVCIPLMRASSRCQKPTTHIIARSFTKIEFPLHSPLPPLTSLWTQDPSASLTPWATDKYLGFPGISGYGQWPMRKEP